MKTFRKLALLIMLIFSCCSAVLSDPFPGESLGPLSGSTTFITFTKLDAQGVDIGCGSEGDMCIAGCDGLLYCYDFGKDVWEQIPLNEEISAITRVDVDDDGRIYIIAECGVFFLDCNDTWVRLPGSAKDIGVGVNFDVWKIGGDKEGENYGVWKLFCECDCNCVCSRVCFRFRKLQFFVCQPIAKKKCHWFRAEIRGINVDVLPNGDAVVVDAAGKVCIVDSKTFEHKELEANNNPAIKAVDVSVGNNGVIYVTAVDLNVYKYNEDTKMWEQVTSATVDALRLCASAYDLVSYISSPDRWVYTSTRFGYLPSSD